MELTKTKICVEEMEEGNNGHNGKQLLPIMMGNQHSTKNGLLLQLQIRLRGRGDGSAAQSSYRLAENPGLVPSINSIYMRSDSLFGSLKAPISIKYT